MRVIAEITTKIQTMDFTLVMRYRYPSASIICLYFILIFNYFIFLVQYTAETWFSTKTASVVVLL